MFVCLHSTVASDACKYWVIPIPWCVCSEVGQTRVWRLGWPMAMKCFMWRDHILHYRHLVHHFDSDWAQQQLDGLPWNVALISKVLKTLVILFVTFHVAPPAGVKCINNCRMNHHYASTYHFGDIPTRNYHWRNRSVNLVYVSDCLVFFTVTITAAQSR